jgi:hypothetical protein
MKAMCSYKTLLLSYQTRQNLNSHRIMNEAKVLSTQHDIKQNVRATNWSGSNQTLNAGITHAAR